MMNSGGDGGLAIEMQMNQFAIMNEDSPYPTRERAKEVVRYLDTQVNMSFFGLFPKQVKLSRELRRNLMEFQITGKGNEFYIWTRVVDIPEVVPLDIEGWVQITSKGVKSEKEIQHTLDTTFGEIPGYDYKAVCINGLYYIYCKAKKDPTL